MSSSNEQSSFETETNEDEEIEDIEDVYESYECKATHDVQDEKLYMEEGIFDVSSRFGLISLYSEGSVYVYKYSQLFEKNYESYVYANDIADVLKVKFINCLTNDSRPILCIITKTEILFYSLERSSENYNELTFLDNNNFHDFININEYLFFIDNQTLKYINCLTSETNNLPLQNINKITHICCNNENILYYINDNELYSYDINHKTEEPQKIISNIPTIFHFCSGFNNNIILFSYDPNDSEKLIISFIDITTKEMKRYSYYYEELKKQPNIKNGSFFTTSSPRYPLVFFSFSKSSTVLSISTDNINDIKIKYSKDDSSIFRPRSSINNENRLELNSIHFIEHKTPNGIINNYSIITTYGTESIFIYSIQNLLKFKNTNILSIDNIEFDINESKEETTTQETTSKFKEEEDAGYEDEDENENDESKPTEPNQTGSESAAIPPPPTTATTTTLTEHPQENENEEEKPTEPKQIESKSAPPPTTTLTEHPQENGKEEDIEEIDEDYDSYECKATHDVQDEKLYMEEGIFDVSSRFGLISLYSEGSVYVYKYSQLFEKNYESYVYANDIADVLKVKFINCLTNDSRPILCIITKTEILFYSLERSSENYNELTFLDNNNFHDFININEYLFFIDNQTLKYINCLTSETNNLPLQNINKITHICCNNENILYYINENELYSYDINHKTEEPQKIISNIPTIFHFCSGFNNNIILFSYDPNDSEKLIISFIDITTKEMKRYSYYYEELKKQPNIKNGSFFTISSPRYPLVFFSFSKSPTVLSISTDNINDIKIKYSKDDSSIFRPRSSINNENRPELNSIHFIEHKTPNGIINNYSIITTYGTESIFIYSIQNLLKFKNTNILSIDNIEFDINESKEETTTQETTSKFKEEEDTGYEDEDEESKPTEPNQTGSESAAIPPPPTTATTTTLTEHPQENENEEEKPTEPKQIESKSAPPPTTTLTEHPQENEKEEDIEEIDEDYDSYECKATHDVQDEKLYMEEGIFDVSSRFGLISLYSEGSVYVYKYSQLFEKKYESYVYANDIEDVLKVKFINCLTNDSRPILCIITKTEILFYSLERSPENYNEINLIDNNNFHDFININEYLFFIDNQTLKYINCLTSETNNLPLQNINKITHICCNNENILYYINENELYSYDINHKTEEPQKIISNIPTIFHFCSGFNNNIILFSYDPNDSEKLIISFIDITTKEMKRYSYYYEELKKQSNIKNGSFFTTSSPRYPLVFFSFSKSPTVLSISTDNINDIKIKYSKDDSSIFRPRSSINNENRLELNSIHFIEHKTPNGIINNYSIITTYGTESIFIYSIQNLLKFKNTNILSIDNIEFDINESKEETTTQETTSKFKEEEDTGYEDENENDEAKPTEPNQTGSESAAIPPPPTTATTTTLTEHPQENENEEDIEEIDEDYDSYECKATHDVQDEKLYMEEGIFDVSSRFGLISLYSEGSVYVYKYSQLFEKNYETYVYANDIEDVLKVKFINCLTNDSRPILCIITKTEILFYSLERSSENYNEINRINNNNFHDFININEYLFFIDNQTLKYINCLTSETNNLPLQNINKITHICCNHENILYYINDNELYSYDINHKTEEPQKIISNIPTIFHFCSGFNNNIILFSYDPNDSEKLIISFIDITTKEMKRYSYYYEELKKQPNIKNGSFFTISSPRYPLVFFSFSKSPTVLSISTDNINDIKIKYSKDDSSIFRPRSSINNENRLELNSIHFIEHKTPNGIINNYSIITTYGTESIFIYSIQNLLKFKNTNILSIDNIEFDINESKEETTTQETTSKFKEEEDTGYEDEDENDEAKPTEPNHTESKSPTVQQQPKENINGNEKIIEEIEEVFDSYECKATHDVQDKELNMEEGIFDVSSRFGLISLYSEGSVYVYKYSQLFEKNYETYVYANDIEDVLKVKFINCLTNDSRPILCIITKTEILFYSLERSSENYNEINRINNNNFHDFININEYLFFIDNQTLKYINCLTSETNNLPLQNINKITHICCNNENILYYINENELYSYDINHKTEEPQKIISNIPTIFHFCSGFNNNIILFSYDPNDSEKLIISFIDITTKEMKRFSYRYEEIESFPDIKNGSFFTISSPRYPLVFFSFSKSPTVLSISTDNINDIKIKYSKDDSSIIRPHSSINNENLLELISMSFIEHSTPNGFINNFSIITAYGTESIFVYSIKGIPNYDNVKIPIIDNIEFELIEEEEEEETTPKHKNEKTENEDEEHKTESKSTTTSNDQKIVQQQPQENENEEDIEEIGEDHDSYECKVTHDVQDKELNMEEGIFDVSSRFGLISLYSGGSVYVYKYSQLFEKNYETYIYANDIADVLKVKFINCLTNDSRPILCIITKSEILFYSLERSPENYNEINRINNNNFHDFININEYLFFIDNQTLKYINCLTSETNNLPLQNINKITHICCNNENILYYINDNELYSYDINHKTEEPQKIISNIPTIFHFCSGFNNNIILFSYDPNDSEKLIISFIDITTKEMKRFSYRYEEIESFPDIKNGSFFTISSPRYPLVFFSFSKSPTVLSISTDNINDIKIKYSKDDSSIIRPHSSINNENLLELISMSFIEHSTPNGFINNFSIITAYGTESIFVYSIKGIPNYDNAKISIIDNIEFELIEEEEEEETTPKHKNERTENEDEEHKTESKSTTTSNDQKIVQQQPQENENEEEKPTEPKQIESKSPPPTTPTTTTLTEHPQENGKEEDIEEIGEDHDSYECKATHDVQDKELNMEESIFDVSSRFGLISLYSGGSVYVYKYSQLFEKNYETYVYANDIEDVLKVKFINCLTNDSRLILCIITKTEILFYSLERSPENYNEINRINNNNFHDFININEYLFFIDNQTLKYINCLTSETNNLPLQNINKITHICCNNENILYYINDNELYSYDINRKTEEPQKIISNIPTIFHFCSGFNNNIILFSYDPNDSEKLIISFIDITTKEMKRYSYYYEELKKQPNIKNGSFFTTSSPRYPLVFFSFSKSPTVLSISTDNINDIKIKYSKDDSSIFRPRSSINNENRLELNSIHFIEHKTPNGIINNYSIITTYGTESIFIYSIQNLLKFKNTNILSIDNIEFDINESKEETTTQETTSKFKEEEDTGYEDEDEENKAELLEIYQQYFEMYENKLKLIRKLENDIQLLSKKTLRNTISTTIDTNDAANRLDVLNSKIKKLEEIRSFCDKIEEQMNIIKNSLE